MYTMAERVRRLDLVNKLKTCGYDIKYIDIYKSVASTMKMSLVEGRVSSGSFNDAFRKYDDTIRYDT